MTEVADDDSKEGDDEDQSSAAESSSTTKGKASESGCKLQKRKSKSSAAEMLTFLSSYVELMKEERKSFFDQLLRK